MSALASTYLDSGDTRGRQSTKATSPFGAGSPFQCEEALVSDKAEESPPPVTEEHHHSRQLDPQIVQENSPYEYGGEDEVSLVEMGEERVTGPGLVDVSLEDHLVELPRPSMPRRRQSPANPPLSQIRDETTAVEPFSQVKPQCWDHGCNGKDYLTFSRLFKHERAMSVTKSKSASGHGSSFSRKTARSPGRAEVEDPNADARPLATYDVSYQAGAFKDRKRSADEGDDVDHDINYKNVAHKKKRGRPPKPRKTPLIQEDVHIEAPVGESQSAPAAKKRLRRDVQGSAILDHKGPEKTAGVDFPLEKRLLQEGAGNVVDMLMALWIVPVT